MSSALLDLSNGVELPCPVCGATMGKEVKALSYGGLCCLSCRAFFRRAHQETKTPDLPCRSGGDCVIDPTTRRRCAKCRLAVCLKNGMRPDMVLTHEQKKKRFQRFNAKKQQSINGGSGMLIMADQKEKKAMSEVTGTIPYELKQPSSISSDFEPQKASPPFCYPYEEAGLWKPYGGFNLTAKMKQSYSKLDRGETVTRPPRWKMTSEDEDVATLKSLLGISEKASLSSSSSKTSETHDVLKNVDKCVDCLKERGSGVDARTVLTRFLRDGLQDFVDAATRLRSRLRDKDDWSSLLRQNKRLAINFVLARFLTGSSPQDRIGWLKPVRATCFCQEHQLGFSDPTAFLREELRLFGQDTVMQDVFLGFARSLSTLNLDPRFKPQLFAALFFHQGNLRVNDSLLVCREFLRAIQDLSRGLGRSLPLHDVYEAGRTLEAMAVMFEHSGMDIPQYSEEVGPSSCFIDLGYTMEEAAWLDRQKFLTFEAMTSVPMGPEVVGELYEHVARGSRLSPAFCRISGMVVRERFWKLCGRHEEFRSLSDEDQMSIVMSANHLYSALITAMMDGMPVEEMTRFCFSPNEVSQHPFLCMARERCCLKGSNSGPLKMRRLLPYLSPEFESCLWRIQSVLKSGDGDYGVFFAVLLTVLFDPVLVACKTSTAKRQRWRGMERLGRRYELALARRFADDWKTMEFSIHTTVLDLRILASMMVISDPERPSCSVTTGQGRATQVV